MPKANSREAKKTNIPATMMEANGKFKIYNIAMAKVIKKPILAANILGALSIIFTDRLRAFLTEWLV